MDYSGENWKPVHGWENLYHVSDQGRVRRLCLLCGVEHSRIIASYSTKQRYLVCTLAKCRVRKRAFVHTLVMEAFVGPRPPGMWINHKDGNKRNNRLSNLEYTTPRDNLIHAVMTGLRPRMKLDSDSVRRIRSRKGLVRSGLVAEEFGITRTHVKSIWKGKSWAHLD